jgi:hypothetical protein
VLVLAAADQNPDIVGVDFAAEPVVDQGDVEVKAAGVVGLELSCLQFNCVLAR